MKASKIKKRLIIGLLTSVIISSLTLAPHGGVYASGTISEIITKVESYKYSGEIWDSDLADSLAMILGNAKTAKLLGDEAKEDEYINAFRNTIDATSGLLISVSAATALIDMTY